jgi:hypothetical protein
MNFEIKKDDSLEDIVNALRKNGVAVCYNYLEDVENIKAECEKIIEETEESDYLFGKAARIGSAYDNIKSNPATANFFSQEWMFHLFQRYTGKAPNFNEIFVQYDYRNDRGTNRNGILHFDRISTFKYMLYLTDVDKASGALSVIPGTHLDGSYLRTNARKTAQNEYDKIKNWPLVDYPELGYTEEDIVPVCGKAGTLIIFDTDIFHLGGLVADDKSRLMIRSHLRG